MRNGVIFAQYLKISRKKVCHFWALDNKGFKYSINMAMMQACNTTRIIKLPTITQEKNVEQILSVF